MTADAKYLKPCPAGHAVRLDMMSESGGVKWTGFIKCQHAGCLWQLDNYDYTPTRTEQEARDHIIAAWNSRPSPSLVERVPEGYLLDSLDSLVLRGEVEYFALLWRVGTMHPRAQYVRGTGPTPEAAVDDAVKRIGGE